MLQSGFGISTERISSSQSVTNMLEFRLRFLSFVQILDGIIKTPGVQGSHTQGVQILSLPWRGTGATEFLLAQPQVHARSFRYSDYSG
jgi:hypothetical protein